MELGQTRHVIRAAAYMAEKEHSPVAADFEQEPGALLRFIDPVHARASEITVAVA
jgi:hypothetical protein